MVFFHRSMSENLFTYFYIYFYISTYLYVCMCAPVHIHAQIKSASDVKVDHIVKLIWSKV